MILVLIFVGALFWDKMERFFSMRLFTFIGFVSYPVYLLHENMMISWMVKIDEHIPVPYWLLPIISFSLVIPIAYLVAKYLEPPIQKKLKVLLKNIK